MLSGVSYVCSAPYQHKAKANIPTIKLNMPSTEAEVIVD